MLGTTDGSPKKDLQLLRESMPVPISYEPGNLSVGGITLDDPSSWADLPQASCAATDFKQRVEPVSIDEICSPKKSRRL